MKKTHNKIALFIGRTGSGKSFFAKALEKKGYRVLKSYTTRPKRNKDDVDHIFISQEEANLITNKVAYTEINNYEYFATKEQIEKNDIYIIDPRGYYELIENAPNYKFNIFYIEGNNKYRENMVKQRSEHDNKNFDKRNASEDKMFTEFEQKIKEGLIKVIIVKNNYNKILPEELITKFPL